jgi:hypothetical protein
MGTIGLKGILEFTDLRIGVTNFDVTFGTEFVFNGSIYFASGGAFLFKGKPVSASLTDRDTADDVNVDGSPNTEALRAELFFEGGVPRDFVFEVDTLNVTLGSFLVLTARARLDTRATGPERVVNFAIGAIVKVGALQIGGEARNFVHGGRRLRARSRERSRALDPAKPLRRGASIGGTSGGALGWPSWLPIKINTLGAEFATTPAGVVDFSDFTIILSASVSGLPAVAGLKFSGAIEGIRIRPQLLAEGKFPIIGIQSLGVPSPADVRRAQCRYRRHPDHRRVRPNVFDWVAMSRRRRRWPTGCCSSDQGGFCPPGTAV